CQQSYSTPPTV
nr:immunoglobulin light chain junction region [Homo sapiens]